MIDVIDEELDMASTDNKIKYQITHADNSTELTTIDLATPVVTNGTPLNRALALSIKNHLDLISRYWQFVGAEQGNYTNPNLTDSDKQGYTISKSGQTTVTIPTGKTIYNLFNSTNTSGFNFSMPSDQTKDVTFTISSPVAIKLANVRFSTRYSFPPNLRVIVKGSNDNSTWTTLCDTYHHDGSSLSTFYTTSTQSYQYFTIRLRNDNGTERNFTMYYMQLNGYIVTSNSTENPIPDYVGTIGEGLRLYVKTIDGYVMYNDVDYNIYLGGELYPLPKTLSANTKYVLVYDGEKFVTEANY